MKKRNFRLNFWGDWKHPNLTLWMYGITDKFQHITKSWSIGYCLYWLNKPWTWLFCRTNGAKKGVDKCLHFQIHLFVFTFDYCNYDYEKVE